MRLQSPEGQIVEDLGPCCACHGTRRVRNIVMLPRRAPVPGTVWGCFVCGLPGDGAIAVLCDPCHAELIEPVEAVYGYASNRGRVAIALLDAAPFAHDPAKHADEGS